MSTEQFTTEINGVTYTDTFVDNKLVSTVWVNADGTGELSRTIADNGDITEITSWTNTGEENPSLTSNYVFNSSGNFLGGTKSENGATYTYNSSWEVTQITYELLLVSSDAYASTFGNSSDVARLFGSEVGDIQFQITNSWEDESDSTNSGKDVSFFDKDTGTKLGVMYVNNGSWTENGTTIISTNINFESVDENGNQQWLGGLWSNYDSAGELRDSGSNSRTTVAYSTLTAPSGLTLPDGVTLEAATEIIVEAGSNTWRERGETFTSESTRYFVEVGSDLEGYQQVYLWETQTRNGVTTAYDSNWNQVGKPQASLDALTALENASGSDQGVVDSAASLELLFGDNLYFLLVNTWQDAQNGNSGKEYSIFDSAGSKLGTMNVNEGSWTDDRTGEEYRSSNIGFNSIDENGNWEWLGGSWKNYDSDGDLRDSGSNTRSTATVDQTFLDGVPSELVGILDDYAEVVVEAGTNTWTDQNGTRTSTFTRYFADDQYNNEIFVGGTETQDGVTRTVDGSWNQLGQPTVDTSDLPTIGATAYTDAYGNAAKVLELFGGADASKVLYKVTNTWQDESNPDNKGTDISFFDSVTGSKLGDMYVNQGSWFDNGEKILSTNIGFNSMDANGEWQWLGGSWSNYDSAGELRDSGSNSRTTVAYSTLTAPSGLTLPDGVTLEAATEIIVEAGSNTWRERGETFTSESTRYFVEVGSDLEGYQQVYLWETQTRNGVTTAYDSNWNQVGKPQASLDALTALENASGSDQGVVDSAASLELLFGDNLYFLLVNTWQDAQNGNSGKEYSIFDSAGSKLGTMNVNEGSWTDDRTGEEYRSSNIGFNSIDENGNWEWLGGSWKNYDSDGDLRDSGSNTRSTATVDQTFLDGVPSELVGILDDYAEVVVEAGTNTWTDQNGTRTSTFTRYFADDQYNNEIFVGGTETQDGVTRTVDGSWNQLGQPTVDTSDLPTIGATAYTDAYGNAAKVLELFGGADASKVLYKVTNTWQDESNPDNKGTDISFFDSVTGSKLGDMYVNQGSWFDNGEKILSTNIGFNSMDANGEWQWLGGSWSNYDSAGELRDSGSNSRTTVAYSTLTAPSGLTLPDGVTLEAATEIIVEAGSNTWRERGETFTSESTRYFVEVGSDLEGYQQVYLWETQTRNGVTTAYDSNWNQVGKPQASLDALTALENASGSDQGVVDSAASLELLFGDNLYFLLVNTWQDAQNGNSGKEYSIFDSAGSKLGTMNVNEGSWTDDRTGEEYRSSNIGFNSIDENGNWEWLGGSWKNYDSDGDLRDSGSNTRSTATVDQTFLDGVPSELVGILDDYAEVVVEAGTNTWTDQNGTRTSTFTRYFADDQYNNEIFVGGTETQDGVTRTVDGSWNQLGQPTVDTSDLPTIGATAYTDAYGNAAKVLELFGGADASKVLYKVTNTWQDESNPDNKGTDISFFDSVTGSKLGDMYVNQGSWFDNGEKILSTNIGFNSMDANGEWQWLGGSWSNYDSAGELRDSGSNSRTTVAYSTLTAPSGLTLPDGVTLEAATEIIVEAGSNTWRERGETFTSESTRYFVEVGSDLEGYQQVYLWETQTRNGVTTAYDSNWNQVGKPQASLDALTALENASGSDQGVVDSAASLELLFGDNLYFLLVNTWQDAQNGNSGKEYSIFDSAGSKLGTMNVNEGSWTDDRTGEEYRSSNIGFNSIDENGNWEWLGGSWKNYDSDGDLRDSGSNTRSTATVDQTFLDGVPSELVGILDDYAEVVVEAGTNTWTDQNGTRTSTFTRYFADDQYNNEIFVGGTETQDGVTRTVDGSWNQLGQPTVDTSDLPTIGATAYTDAYGNAAKVLELFGGADASKVLYKVTNTWQDESNPDNKGTDISFFDSVTGSKLGDMYVNQGSWFDNGEKILSTNIGFNSMDANGEWQWLGGSWSNYDSAGELRDSGSNSRTTVAYSTLTAPSGLTLPDGVTLEAATEIIVEAGSNTWRERGETFTSESTRYFVEVGSDLEGYQQVYLWETQTRNGVTTAYDSNWNQVGKPQASLDALTALENASGSDQGVVDSAASLELLFGDNLYFLLVNTWQDAQNGNSGKEYSIFDSAGSKLGTMNVNEGSWTDDRTGEEYRSSNIGFNSIDENGNWERLGGSWKNYDSNLILRDSGSNTRSTATVDQTFLDGVPSELVGILDDYAEVVVEAGTNRRNDPGEDPRESTFTRYFADNGPNGQTFLGGTETQDGVTRTVDGSWNQLGQPTVDTSDLPTIGATAYTDAYDNAAKVLELFGAPDATADTIKYKITNSRQEGEDSFTEISFFAADSSIKLGLMFVDERSWIENNETISSTNINFDSVDQNGQQQWIAGSYTNYAGEILRDSGSNSRTTKAVADLTDVPNEIDLTGYTDVIVEISINTRFDPQGNPSTWEVTRYFEEGDNGQFLGEIGIGSDGFTRVIDRDGKGYESNSNNPDNGEGNNEPWTTIETDTYSLDLPPASWGGWNLQAKGTFESETLDLASIAQEQGLADMGIAIDSIYTRIYGAGGNDKLYGAGGMDSLRVHFDGSNFVDGRSNPAYLGSDGNFFSAHDRYVIFHDVATREDWYPRDYFLLGVRAIVDQNAANADVALKDLATPDALKIDSVVNLMNGEAEDEPFMSQLPSLLSQAAEKAVSLGIGDMLLGDLTSLMMKVQSVSLEDQSLTVEVDFIKDIDMVTVIGVLPDGNEFTATQNMINSVEYTLVGDDSSANPYSLGSRGVYQGTNASDQVDLSGSDVGYYIRMGGGNDTVVGTSSADIFSLQSLQSLQGGVKTIDGGSGNDAADIDLIGMFNGDPSNFGLNVQFDERTVTYTVFDSFADNMKEILTVRADTQTGGWTAESTIHGKEQFNLADKANLTNVESIRIFMGVDPENNNEPVLRTLDLTVLDKIISTETYTLDLRYASSGISVIGTDGPDVLNLSDIALAQNLVSDGIDVSTLYNRLDGGMGDDQLTGSGGMDSLRVNFEGSNFLDGGSNPAYLGSDGNFFSAHDRYVIYQDLADRDAWDQGDYVLVGVRAIVDQNADNAKVALKYLATSEALKIDSVVNLLNGESEDELFMSLLPSVLSQVAAKAESLGIGDMLLEELDGVMIKVQSADDQSLTVEVDFIKDIDMVTVIGVLPDGNEFTATQNMINSVEYTLVGDDSSANPYSLGSRGVYQGTNASDQVDLSGSDVGYYIRMGGGNDTVVGTSSADIFSLQSLQGGVKTIDGGSGNDAADIDLIGMFNGDPSNFGLNVQFDERTVTYTVFDSFADNMKEILTVRADTQTGGWTAESTIHGKEQFNLADANLTNVESIRIFMGVDPENNNEPVLRTLDLTVLDKIISTETYTLDLRYASFGISVIGTDGSDVLNLSEIALAQNLANDGIDVSTLYNRLDGGMGDDRLTGSQGADSLRVSFDGSNFLDGRSNPAYLGSDGNFFSAHDRYVIYEDVTSREEWNQGNYSLVAVDAIVAQSAGNADIALKDLATSGASGALQIDSIVNLMSGELEDMSVLPSLLSQVAEKAVLLGIGDMLLGDLTSIMMKVQSVSLVDQSLTIEVDFIKDIDMVSVVGVLADGSEFTPAQVFINPVEYTLTGDDDFANIYSLGVRGSYLGTNASETIDLSTAGDSSAGYSVYPGMGDDSITGTKYADIINLQAGDKNIDGGDGVDVLDITSYLNDGHNLTVNFDSATMTYTVFDTTVTSLNDGALSYSDSMMFTAALQENGSWRVESSGWGKGNFRLGDATLNNIESIRVFHAFDNNEPVYQTLELVGVMPAQNG